MTGSRSPEAAREIAATFEAWFRALAERDESFFEHVLDDDWVYTDVNGVVRSKSDYFVYMQDIPPNVAGEVVELEARVHGDLAIVTGLYRIAATAPDGARIGADTRMTAVWQHTGDGWRCLAHHGTRAPES